MNIYERLELLNELEYSIYFYMNENKEKMKHSKIIDLANELHVSTTMITRVCKKLGFSGFTEYRAYLKLEQEENKNNHKQNLEYILDFFRKVDNSKFYDKIKSVKVLLLESDDILFFGTGLSADLASYGAGLLNRKGIKTTYINQIGTRIRDVYKKNDTAVIFSVSGDTEETNKFIAQCKSCGINVVLITNKEISQGAKMADILICYYVPNEKDKYCVNSATQIPVVYILECIAEEL